MNLTIPNQFRTGSVAPRFRKPEIELFSVGERMTQEFYTEYLKFWGDWPGENVHPIFSVSSVQTEAVVQ